VFSRQSLKRLYIFELYGTMQLLLLLLLLKPKLSCYGLICSAHVNGSENLVFCRCLDLQWESTSYSVGHLVSQ